MENSFNLKPTEVNELLIVRSEQYNTPSFFQNDPISIPKQFKNQKDIEIIGFLVATISWGKRESIINSGKKLVKIMGESPYEYVKDYEDGMVFNSEFVYRTFNTVDLDFFLRALRECYSKNESLESWFYLNQGEFGIKQRIVNFRNQFLSVSHEKRSEKHIPNPEKGSAAKRINMFLRWMVRKDSNGVDFGIWKDIKSYELYIPLDIHTSRIARSLGILERKQNDWKALEALMQYLRNLDPNDPAKFDFALFGIGITGELDELEKYMDKAREIAKQEREKQEKLKNLPKQPRRLDEIRQRLGIIKKK